MAAVQIFKEKQKQDQASRTAEVVTISGIVGQSQLTEKQLVAIEKNPKVLLKSLTAIEYEIFEILFFSEHALSAKAVQRENALRKLREDIRKHDVNTEKKIEELESIATNEIFAKAHDKKLTVLSHTTVSSSLGSMVVQGLVFKREIPRDKKNKTIYFVNPTIAALLKESHDAEFLRGY